MTSVRVGEVPPQWLRFQGAAAAMARALYTAPPASPWTAAGPVSQATVDVVTRYWGHHVSLWIASFLSSNALQFPSTFEEGGGYHASSHTSGTTQPMAFTEEFLVDVLTGLCLGAGHLFCRCVGCQAFQLVFPPLGKRPVDNRRVLSVAAMFMRDRRAARVQPSHIGGGSRRTRAQRPIDPQVAPTWAIDACRSVWLLYRHSRCMDDVATESPNLAFPVNLHDDGDETSINDEGDLPPPPPSTIAFSQASSRWTVTDGEPPGRIPVNTVPSAVHDTTTTTTTSANPETTVASFSTPLTGFYSGSFE